MVMKRTMNAGLSWLPILGIVIGLVITMGGGCAGPAAEHEAEEAHALPEHHPRTFRRAVVDIGHRGTVLTSGMLDDAGRELECRQLLDIVRWLPQLAADTELGRHDWERVNHVADTLARALGSFQAAGQPAPDRDAALSATLTAAMQTLSEVDSSLEPDIPVEKTS